MLYTLTYTPADDRILPTPTELHVKIRNTSAIPLRAAYLHGPYTLYTSCYPSTFDPNRKHTDHDTEGGPQYEPNLKAGGGWNAVLTVPDRTRSSTALRQPSHPSEEDKKNRSVTWIIEIASQVIFSTTAAVHYELLVGRDEKALDLTLGAITGVDIPKPGHLHDHRKMSKDGRWLHHSGNKGIYSGAVELVVDDTTSLWNTPYFPPYDHVHRQKQHAHHEEGHGQKHPETPKQPQPATESSDDPKPKKKQKKVHFVVLTHGLHSNLGADMLYLKESIDAAARNSRMKTKERREKERKARASKPSADGEQRTPTISEPSDARESPQTGSNEEDGEQEYDDDDEEVIVRGFSGNVIRTERGIQYLGKRLAKYVMLMTYPDKPFPPPKSPRLKTLTWSLTGQKSSNQPTEQPPSGHHEQHDKSHLLQDPDYEITSISFIGHSLGGLIQTYAIAYIQKHCPEFFENIRPVNFVCLASPLLGLSNENPVYVKFALDFGLVGRTGQDLGLSWSAPSRMRGGWDAVFGGLGGDKQNSQDQPDPGAKPLLRILPSGPAHYVLKKFRKRTVYSNVVNDGIVPLRTSCLLFLDWRGLERVEKARRANGLVGTMAEWGWAELTGANSSSPRLARPTADASSGETAEEDSATTKGHPPTETEVPEVDERTANDDNFGLSKQSPDPRQFLHSPTDIEPTPDPDKPKETSPPNTLSSFLSLFRPHQAKSTQENKHTKIYKRSQTLKTNPSGDFEEPSADGSPLPSRGKVSRGDFLGADGLQTPPRTTILESAGDLLKPPLPPPEFLIDPSQRPRTIFHDQVYHPDDIPPPPPVRYRTMFGASTHSGPGHESSYSTSEGSRQSTKDSEHSEGLGTSSGMKVEEKIARAYHKDLSWRKVLVRLEPDAHNNIIVRRMFANAFGWPVIKHLVDTHFGYTAMAQTEDTELGNAERAMPMTTATSVLGDEVEGQADTPPHQSWSVRNLERMQSQNRKSENENSSSLSPAPPPPELEEGALSPYSEVGKRDSDVWSDRYLSNDEHSHGTVSPAGKAAGGPSQSPRTEKPEGPATSPLVSDAPLRDSPVASPTLGVVDDSGKPQIPSAKEDLDVERSDEDSTPKPGLPGLAAREKP
ncbi:hypothetical protein FQN54_002469 [Arachnomyces sp. PD_36]|nr:hypothetical protein FQN54_002469 [Arachnomyces sp. PD_36]